MNVIIRSPYFRFHRKLSNIADIVGGGTPSTSNPDYWDGNIDWYTPAEIGEQIFANGSVRKSCRNRKYSYFTTFGGYKSGLSVSSLP